MKTKKNIMVKMLAVFALIGIIISIIGTAILVITSGGWSSLNQQEPTLTPQQLQEIINSQSSSIEYSATGSDQ